MAPAPPAGLRERVPLAPLTTLGLGGPARYFVEPPGTEALAEALAWAAASGVRAVVLGGGSNVVVADAGVDALVVHPVLRGIERRPAGPPEGGPDGEPGVDTVLVTAAASEPWDPFVRGAVSEELAGLECLSGIPGTVGASPVQNVGAYGREVAEVLDEVRVLDRRTLEERVLSVGECAFAYRDSRFRREPDRFVVLAASFRLTPGGAPTVRYPELERMVVGGGASPTLDAVREAVLALRRGKSMVLEAGDPNRRSVGSFFVNPVLPAEEAERVEARALALGVAEDRSAVPRFPAGDGRVKLSAAWLIEAAGFRKGERRGPVGISSRHSLALVHHGDGRTADLLALAREIRDRVRERFGVTLRPEPVFLGFQDDEDEGKDPLGG